LDSRQRYRPWIPYIILVGIIITTLLFSHYAATTTQARDQVRFDSAVQRTQGLIQNRIDTYVALLYAGRGLFAADERLDRESFEAFISQLELRERYPGIQGIGFSIRVQPEEVEALVTEMRQQGFEGFTLHPQLPVRSEYHSIIYLEPLDERNQAAIGFDMFSEPTRREAMERARDTGSLAATRKVILVQEIDPDQQAGFLIYLPVYTTNEVPATVTERRETLQGFIYIPFRADDLLAGIFSNENRRNVDIQVYDGTELSPAHLLHRSNSEDAAPVVPRFSTTTVLDVAGQRWSIVFTSRPEFEASLERTRVPYIFISGLLFGLVVFVISRSQNRARIAAEKIALSLQRSEAALRESESRLRCLVEANIIGIVISDRYGQILEANDAFLNIIGYTREEVLAGQVTWSHIAPHGDDTDTFHNQPFQNRPTTSRHTSTPYEPYEREYLRKDGSRVSALVGTAILTEPELKVGFVLDLTEQKRAERAVQQSELRFRTLIEQSPLSIQIFNPEGKTIRVNRAWETLWGMTIDDLADYNILHDLQLAEKGILPDIQRGFAGESVMLSPIHYDPNQTLPGVTTNSAPQRWTQAYIYPVKEEGGKIREVVLIHEDITERKLAEIALKSSNDRLGLLYSISSSLLLHEQPNAFLTSLFSQLSSHLQLEVYFNYLLDRQQQMLRLHTYSGIPESSVSQTQWVPLGQGICGTVASERRSIVMENVQHDVNPISKLIRSLGVTAYACYPLIARGQLIGTLSFGTRNRPRFTGDELALMQVMSEQVASALERSRLIAELQQQTQELEQANRAKDEFLATLSHELRTPLNAMLGWTQLLRARTFDETMTNRALETIERNTKSLAQLIEDILDVSRIITGKLRLSVTDVELIPVIEAAIDTVRPAAETKNIHLTAQLESSIETVSGDPQRIQQMVWNLLSNAVKFTPQGGQVEVRLERGIAHQAPNQHPYSSQRAVARISITDTGQGIDPAFLPYVFDRFRQADSSTTRSYGGLGLGLAIVRHLTELQGGTVSALSEGQGKGATFIIELPVQSQAQLPSEKQETAYASVHLDRLALLDTKILVVDDEADTRELIATILKQAGAVVKAVPSAREALNALPQVQPAILVSDIGMPEMDGYMLIQAVRQLPDEQGGTIPAIALTAYVGEMNQQQALTAGFQLHLPKPIEPDSLVQAVATLMNSRSGSTLMS
jgi:PAS domain S-box-containing protein